jgi:hypothetical protein
MLSSEFWVAAVVLIILALTLLGYIALLRSFIGLFKVVLVAPVILGLVILVSTETLSFLVGISLISVWVTTAIFIVFLALNFRRVACGFQLIGTDLNSFRSELRLTFSNASLTTKSLQLSLVVGLLITLVTLFLALWGPPNNADSLEYHLPRIMHWFQNGSVEHYATPELRQLGAPTLHGYFLLWLYSLTGTDYLLNMIQWAASLWSSLVIAGILHRSLRSWKPAIIGFVLAISVPIGIAEASTTQNDWISALWVLIAVGLYVERQTRSMAFRIYLPLLISATILVGATKPTGMVSMAAVVILAAVSEFLARDGTRVQRLNRFLLVGLGSLLGVLIGFLPQALRNMATFETVFGDQSHLLVERFDLATLGGNSFRIVLNNVGIPRVFGDFFNPHLESVFQFLRISWVDVQAVGYGHLPSISLARNEDYATNPIQLIGGLLAAVIILVLPRIPRLIRILGALALSMFVLSAIVWKWNQWTNRFLIQVILLLVIPLAFLLWKALKHRASSTNFISVVGAGIVLFAAIYGLFVSVTNQYRPLIDGNSALVVSRDARYFTVQGLQEKGFIDKAALELIDIPEGSVVGIKIDGVREYPIWALLNKDRKFTFVHVDVDNPSGKYERSDIDAFICIGQCSADQGATN